MNLAARYLEQRYTEYSCGIRAMQQAILFGIYSPVISEFGGITSYSLLDEVWEL